AEDDEFLIRLPLKLSEIIKEGSSLNQCVGGYVDRHANGDTTILFLRKKSDKDKSFYTIECHGTDPNKGIDVRQIHGQNNKWLGNNPEVVPFVLRWLRDKGIKCRDEIVLSTARGYSSWNATMIPKPEI
ncbi:MAG: PcfJ domain-containing protein, partial [Paludibacteraceae bacterium]|nr:PcfJ domain-containing protein [Paludibacteraceae bacterium]